MGQKVNPHGARVGVIFDWSTRWYAEKKDFANHLIEDHKLREMLKEKFYATGISRIDIERSDARMTVNIFTGKPGMIIGRGGKGIAASFGALLGLLPWNLSLLALAAPYVLLSTVVRIRPHAKRSVVSYLVFAAAALVVNPPSIALGCLLIAAPVVARHWPELRSA